MKKSLLENLIAFYEEDPDDPFNVYALALEYSKSNMEKAAYYFEILLASHANYLPSYYVAGAFFAEIGNVEKAGEIYTNGIALAENQQQTKTHQELLRAYRGFLDELDD